MPASASYRLIDREGHELRVASFDPNTHWRIGDPINLGRDASYVIVDIQDGDALVRATLVVDRLP